MLTLGVRGFSGPTTRFPYQWSQGLGRSLELTEKARKGTPDPGVGHWPQVRGLLCYPSVAGLGGTRGRLSTGEPSCSGLLTVRGASEKAVVARRAVQWNVPQPSRGGCGSGFAKCSTRSEQILRSSGGGSPEASVSLAAAGSNGADPNASSSSGSSTPKGQRAAQPEAEETSCEGDGGRSPYCLGVDL